MIATLMIAMFFIGGSLCGLIPQVIIFNRRKKLANVLIEVGVSKRTAGQIVWYEDSPHSGPRSGMRRHMCEIDRDQIDRLPTRTDDEHIEMLVGSVRKFWHEERGDHHA